MYREPIDPQFIALIKYTFVMVLKLSIISLIHIQISFSSNKLLMLHSKYLLHDK